MQRTAILAAILLFAFTSFRKHRAQTELAAYIKANYQTRSDGAGSRRREAFYVDLRTEGSLAEVSDTSEPYPIFGAALRSGRVPGNTWPKPALCPRRVHFRLSGRPRRWMSEGEFENARPDIANTKPTEIDESTDTYDTIEWLIKNVEGNNGRVGTYGISYRAFTFRPE